MIAEAQYIYVYELCNKNIITSALPCSHVNDITYPFCIISYNCIEPFCTHIIIYMSTVVCNLNTCHSGTVTEQCIWSDSAVRINGPALMDIFSSHRLSD